MGRSHKVRKHVSEGLGRAGVGVMTIAMVMVIVMVRIQSPTALVSGWLDAKENHVAMARSPAQRTIIRRRRQTAHPPSASDPVTTSAVDTHLHVSGEKGKCKRIHTESRWLATWHPPGVVVYRLESSGGDRA